MNTRIVLFPLALACLFGSFAHAADVDSLLSADFEKPTELTYNFPPLPGEKWSGPLDNRLSVTSNNGQAKIMFGGGYGAASSGGLYVEVVKPATVYMQVNYDRLQVFSGELSGLTLARVQALQLGFDAKIPAGSKLEIYLMPILPKDWGKRAWAGRLPLGEVAGTGEFKTYTLVPTNAVAAENFLKLIQEHGLNNGATEFKVTLGFKLLPLAAWTVGSSLQLDNLHLGQTAPTK